MNFKTFEDEITEIYEAGIKKEESLEEIFDNIFKAMIKYETTVENKVMISKFILEMLSEEQRIELCKALLNEQILNQRKKLGKWGTITAQSTQIDTGYIAQHLVSLRTQIPGQGMRGKGDDLFDGSEVKAANFLDSLDKKGATAPRWNFTAVTPKIMEKFLTYNPMYLLSVDLDGNYKIRIRIWTVNVDKHDVLKERYILWMNTKGYKKFANNKNESVNFQLFPPRMFKNETCARHGNNRANGYPAIEIDLENNDSSKLIFYAIQTDDGFEVNFY